MKINVKSPLLWGLFLIAADQFTKYLIYTRLYPGQAIEVTPFFRIVYAMNTGIAFSMFQGANHVFSVITALIIGGFLLWYRKNRAAIPPALKAAFTLVIAGAAGNLIDRVAHGYVVDFLDFSIGSYHWPAFNVADSCITVGGILLFLLSFFVDQQRTAVPRDSSRT